MGGLRLDSLEAMKKGGKRGSSIAPGDPENSLLVKSIRQTDENFKMPMGGKLKPAEVASIEAWVKAGAVWPKPAGSGKRIGHFGRWKICDRTGAPRVLVLEASGRSESTRCEGCQVGQERYRQVHPREPGA